MPSAFSLLLAASFVTNTHAWGALGHMLVAQIALNRISTQTSQQTATLVAELATYYTKSPDFVTAAVWADDLKGLAENVESPLHYIDIPVVRGSVPDVPPALNVSCNPWAIDQAVVTLSSAYAISIDQARQLRFLLHFVGDLHQPLHASSLFSSEFPPPEGDVGGNRYYISGASSSNLHSLWDSGLGYWSTNINRPLNATGRAFIEEMATAITTAYPASGFGPQLAITDPWEWATESNALAASFVYTCPQSSEGDVPAAYISQGYEMAQSQVALGGYRLALLLDSIYDAKRTPAAGAAAAHGSLRGASAVAA